MVRLAPERVLLIGDSQRELQAALSQAAPAAQVTAVPTIFDGIAELAGGAHGGANGATGPGNAYTTVIAAAEPIERRPEAAVRTLRSLAGDGRLVLFGHAGHEVLSRKMLPFGCDDYLVLPADQGEIRQMLGAPPMRLAPPPADGNAAGTAPNAAEQQDEARESAPADTEALLGQVPIADILLDALLTQPHNPLAGAVREVNAYLSPALELVRRGNAEPPPAAPPGYHVLSHDLTLNGEPDGALYLLVRSDQDETAAQDGLTHLAHLIGKMTTLQDRHSRLQKLAITDELTGVYNGRYFRHFLTRIVERARKMHFPVTLLLFDIDDFKQYNDRHGHGMGDEILKQTAALMKRCTREHDLVARIGGDEFAVVFWDKEGPRQPREPRPGIVSRPPQSPQQVFQRFKNLIAGDEFTALGQSGKGVLGVSAGLAVYPYDAQDVAGLIKEADRALMQGAKKKCGKNSLYIVGTDDPTFPPTEAQP